MNTVLEKFILCGDVENAKAKEVAAKILAIDPKNIAAKEAL